MNMSCPWCFSPSACAKFSLATTKFIRWSEGNPKNPWILSSCSLCLVFLFVMIQSKLHPYGHLGSWRHVHNSPRCPQAVPCWSSWCTSLTHWFPWNWLFGPEFQSLNLAFTCHTPLVGDGLFMFLPPFGSFWLNLGWLIGFTTFVNQTIPILRNSFRVLPFGKSYTRTPLRVPILDQDMCQRQFF